MKFTKIPEIPIGVQKRVEKLRRINYLRARILLDKIAGNRTNDNIMGFKKHILKTMNETYRKKKLQEDIELIKEQYHPGEFYLLKNARLESTEGDDLYDTVMRLDNIKEDDYGYGCALVFKVIMIPSNKAFKIGDQRYIGIYSINFKKLQKLDDYQE